MKQRNHKSNEVKKCSKVLDLATEEGKEEGDCAGPKCPHVRILLSGATQAQQRQLCRLVVLIHIASVLHVWHAATAKEGVHATECTQLTDELSPGFPNRRKQ